MQFYFPESNQLFKRIEADYMLTAQKAGDC